MLGIGTDQGWKINVRGVRNSGVNRGVRTRNLGEYTVPLRGSAEEDIVEQGGRGIGRTIEDVCLIQLSGGRAVRVIGRVDHLRALAGGGQFQFGGILRLANVFVALARKIGMVELDTAVDPDQLVERLPDPPGRWERNNESGGVVEYRIAGDDGICAAAKLTIRPDVLSDSAVRLDRKQGCKSAGTDRFEDIAAAIETVEMELAASNSE